METWTTVGVLIICILCLLSCPLFKARLSVGITHCFLHSKNVWYHWPLNFAGADRMFKCGVSQLGLHFDVTSQRFKEGCDVCIIGNSWSFGDWRVELSPPHG